MSKITPKNIFGALDDNSTDTQYFVCPSTGDKFVPSVIVTAQGPELKLTKVVDNAGNEEAGDETTAYMQGVNVQEYEVDFDNVKTVTVPFSSPFSKKPIVTITMQDSGAVPAYKQAVTTTGCTVRFKTPYIGKVTLLVMAK